MGRRETPGGDAAILLGTCSRIQTGRRSCGKRRVRRDCACCRAHGSCSATRPRGIRPDSPVTRCPAANCRYAGRFRPRQPHPDRRTRDNPDNPGSLSPYGKPGARHGEPAGDASQPTDRHSRLDTFREKRSARCRHRTRTPGSARNSRGLRRQYHREEHHRGRQFGCGRPHNARCRHGDNDSRRDNSIRSGSGNCGNPHRRASRPHDDPLPGRMARRLRGTPPGRLPLDRRTADPIYRTLHRTAYGTEQPLLGRHVPRHPALRHPALRHR